MSSPSAAVAGGDPCRRIATPRAGIPANFADGRGIFCRTRMSTLVRPVLTTSLSTTWRTPVNEPAIFTARSRSSGVSTLPASVTTASFVSTSICSVFSPGSANSARLYFCGDRPVVERDRRLDGGILCRAATSCVARSSFRPADSLGCSLVATAAISASHRAQATPLRAPCSRRHRDASSPRSTPMSPFGRTSAMVASNRATGVPRRTRSGMSYVRFGLRRHAT